MPRPPDKPTPRQVLSANLRALMATRPDLDVIKKVVKVSGLSNGKVGRIYAASHTTDIDTLADLAEAFGLEPWQLLVPDLNPQRIPELSTTPLLEQVRSLVQKGLAQSGEDYQKQVQAVSSTEAKPRKTAGQATIPSPTLDRVSLVTLKGEASGKGGRTQAVQKPGSGRNSAGTSRTRGSGRR